MNCLNIFFQVTCLFAIVSQHSIHSHWQTHRRSKSDFNYTELFKDLPSWAVSDRENKDCLANVRKYMRVYPNDCYTHTFDGQIRYTEFYRFWPQVRGDLSFTFDYVLYDNGTAKGHRRYTNMLFYLIKYLKIVAINIQNPVNISPASDVDSIVPDEIRKQIDEVIKHSANKKYALLRSHNISVNWFTNTKQWYHKHPEIFFYY